MAQLECFLAAPHQAEAAEVKSLLPLPGACPYLADRFFEMLSLTEPLGVLIGQVASHLGVDELAECHVKTALGYHKNPVKIMHARALAVHLFS